MSDSRYVTMGRDQLIARLDMLDAGIATIRLRAEACRSNAMADPRNDLEMLSWLRRTARVDAYDMALSDLQSTGSDGAAPVPPADTWAAIAAARQMLDQLLNMLCTAYYIRHPRASAANDAVEAVEGGAGS